MGRRQRIIEIYTNHGEVTFHENDPRPYTRCVPTTQLCQKWDCGLASLFQAGLVQVARSSGHWPTHSHLKDFKTIASLTCAVKFFRSLSRSLCGQVFHILYLCDSF